MADCNEAIRPIYDRRSMLLRPSEYDRWLNGSFKDALGFHERCSPDEQIEMNRMSAPWV
jgi:putative SOS response-associated peptidase YedK